MEKGTSDADLKAVSNKFLATIKELQSSKAWQQVDDKPVLVSKLQREERAVVRAEVILNLPFEVVAKYFQDPSLMKKISDRCAAFEILHQFENLTVFHAQMEGFAMVSDRQLVAVLTYHKESDSKVYVGNRSCDYACLGYKDAVRAFAHCGGYIIEKVAENKTRLTNIIDLDPNGSIPGFMKNKMATMRANVLAELEEKIKASLK